ncbi:hypothetical protein [Streptomyces labedae]|uniref:Uncharacterized protein n=1 Tax=Streptomyces labedae TaxID=285569 RepID=A0ABP6R1V6_9ACTN
MGQVEGLTLVRVVRTCSAHPSQWDAWTAEGQYLYLRYRHGEGCVERRPGPDVDTPESWNEGLSAVLPSGTTARAAGPSPSKTSARPPA